MDYEILDSKVIIPSVEYAKEYYRNEYRKNIINLISEAAENQKNEVEVSTLPFWLREELEQAGYSIHTKENVLRIEGYVISFR